MDTRILEEMGFTPKETDVYIAILKMKNSSVFEIMSKAKVSRQSIYEIIQKLLDKGLINYIIKENKKQYNAVNPQRLVELIEEKEANLQGLLPDLLKRYNKKKEDTKFEIFVGKEGMKTTMNHCLKIGKPLYALANEDKILDFLKYYMPQHLMAKKRENIKTKIIFNEEKRKNNNIKLPLTDLRYLTNEFCSSLTFAVYGENVNLIVFSNPMIISIKSKEISDSFMNYFNLMWKMAKE